MHKFAVGNYSCVFISSHYNSIKTCFEGNITLIITGNESRNVRKWEVVISIIILKLKTNSNKKENSLVCIWYQTTALLPTRDVKSLWKGDEYLQLASISRETEAWNFSSSGRRGQRQNHAGRGAAQGDGFWNWGWWERTQGCPAGLGTPWTAAGLSLFVT